MGHNLKAQKLDRFKKNSQSSIMYELKS